MTSLVLNRLSRRECAALVDKVTEGMALPAEVLDEILSKTDGIPLFVEELTKTVLDSGLLVNRGDRYGLIEPLPPLAIPSSLQDSLMARLDRLAPVCSGATRLIAKSRVGRWLHGRLSTRCRNGMQLAQSGSDRRSRLKDTAKRESRTCKGAWQIMR